MIFCGLRGEIKLKGSMRAARAWIQGSQRIGRWSFILHELAYSLAVHLCSGYLVV